MTFPILLLGHLLGDFPLQTNWVMRHKLEHRWGIFLHASIHGVVTAFLVQSWLSALPLLMTLVLVHFAIDWLKLHLPSKTATRGFLLDQLAHLVVIVLLSIIWPSLQSYLVSPLLMLGILLGMVPAILIFLAVRSTDKKDHDSPLWQHLLRERARLILSAQIVGSAIILSLIALQCLQNG